MSEELEITGAEKMLVSGIQIATAHLVETIYVLGPDGSAFPDPMVRMRLRYASAMKEYEEQEEFDLLMDPEAAKALALDLAQAFNRTVDMPPLGES